MRNIRIIAKREIVGYFITPLAYIFIVIFLALIGAFAFYIGRFSPTARPAWNPFSPITRGFT